MLISIAILAAFVGSEVVIVKNGRRICGTGAALANAPIVQNKAYFEVKLQCTGRSRYYVNAFMCKNAAIS